jgi:hypothetical protein
MAARTSSRSAAHTAPVSAAYSGVLVVVRSRGRGRSTRNSVLTVPGWAVITTTRSPSSTASSIECVT